MQPTDPTTPLSPERQAEVLGLLDQATKWTDFAPDVSRDLNALRVQNLLSPPQSNKLFNLLFENPQQNPGENPPLTPEQEKFRKGYTDGIIGATIKGVTLEDAYDWRFSRDPAEYPAPHTED